MKHLSIKLFMVLMLLVSINTTAQDFQGQAIYQTKTTVDMSSWGRGGQMSDQQKKQIAERMKSMLEKTYVLIQRRRKARCSRCWW